ncbi:unnamed protein product [Amoebophrya sp. A120]|nr:unnamed protein product [Amoebophrya sp. A120]|eukprot:GSA120T00019379001.1
MPGLPHLPGRPARASPSVSLRPPPRPPCLFFGPGGLAPFHAAAGPPRLAALSPPACPRRPAWRVGRLPRSWPSPPAGWPALPLPCVVCDAPQLLGRPGGGLGPGGWPFRPCGKDGRRLRPVEPAPPL